MHSKLFVFIIGIVLSAPCFAQVGPDAEKSRADLSGGAGIDYWKGDWNGVTRFGPSVWITDTFWHGIGVNIEGHSMIAGGPEPSPEYKYFVGEGGIIYNYYHFRRFTPYAKAELGFASLSFPHRSTSTYTHDTRNTWALGGGVEYRLAKHLWTRVDYTYDGFPNFYSSVSGKYHTLNPNGFAIGPTYHFR